MGTGGVSVGGLWTDITRKWQLHQCRSGAPAWSEHSADAAAQAFEWGRAALLAGRLDEARAGFLAAAARRDHALDHAGLGDVAAAAGDWQRAAERYRRAAALDARDPIVRIGLAQARIADGDAWSAVRDLGTLAETAGGAAGGAMGGVSRYYLAAALLAGADQARARTEDDLPVFASTRQLEICEQAAVRILALGVDEPAVTAAANRLLDDVAAARRWTWDRWPAAGYLVLTVVLGLAAVVAGGLVGSVALVLAGVVLGPVLIFWIVLGYRREQWRRAAERLAPLIQRRGVAE